MSNQTTSKASSNVISSPESQAGLSDYAALAGPMIGPFGPALAHVNHFPSRDWEKDRPMKDISGPFSSDSSKLVDPQSSSESKLQSPQVPSQSQPSTSNERSKRWRERNPERSREISRASRLANRASNLISDAKKRSKQKNLPYDLDSYREQLQTRIEKGFCELTGLPFKTTGGARDWNSPSLDRVIPEEGYVIENVRVILFGVNVMMLTWGLETTMKMIEALTEKERQRKESFQARFEENLENRLRKIGSTECSLTFRRSLTPAGRPLLHVVPSMRPIGEIDFGLWPTARCGNNGGFGNPERALDPGNCRLEDTAAWCHRAMWPTPNASDEKWRYSTQEAAMRRIETGKQVSLECAAHSMWPSPTASLSDKGIRSPEGAMVEIERGKSPDLAAHVMAMWPTPSKSDATAGADMARRDNDQPNSKLSTTVHLAGLWPTPAAGMHNDGEDPASFRARQEKWKDSYHNSPPLPIIAKEMFSTAEMWRTPRANDHKGGLRPDSDSQRPTSDHFLPDQVNFTIWSTPSARDWKDSPGMAQTGVNPDGSTRTRLDQLPRQVALYPTPTSLAPARNGNNEAGNPAGLVAIRAIAIGMPQSGSSVQTEKPGALAPDFVAWLMGFPTTWLECAPEAMPKSRSKRSPSSPTASKRASANSGLSVTPSFPTSPPKSSAPISTPTPDLGVFG